MGSLIEAKNAAIFREGSTVLTNIDLTIMEGMAVAVTGMNGSGKSSLIKLMAGLCEPQSGNIIRQFSTYAYVPEHFPEYLPFTVEQYLRLMAEMGGGLKREKLDKYINNFGLEPFLQTPLKKCSKGTKQKAGFIQALLKEADMLFLDEPFTGLDEAACEIAMNMLLDLKGKKTMMFVFHDEVLVQKLASHVAKLQAGRLMDFSMAQPIKQSFIITCETSSLPEKVHIRARNIQYLAGGKIKLTVGVDESDFVLKQLLKHGAHIIEVKARKLQ